MKKLKTCNAFIAMQVTGYQIGNPIQILLNWERELDNVSKARVNLLLTLLFADVPRNFFVKITNCAEFHCNLHRIGTSI